MESEDMVSEEKLMRKLSLDWGISPYFLGIFLNFRKLAFKSNLRGILGIDAWKVKIWKVRGIE
jgi:hypothetical protein